MRKLAEELKSNGLKVWIDEDEILVGHDFIAKMEEGIAKSDFVVVTLTPNFMEGLWAQEEYRNALKKQVDENRIVLLPVLKKDCEIPGFLSSKNYADFRKNFKNGFRSLLYSLRRHPEPDR